MSRIFEIAMTVACYLFIIAAVMFAIPARSTFTSDPPNGARHAQNIASVYDTAIAVGADFGDRNNVRSIVELLSSEGVYGSGPYANAYFLVDISPEELDAAEPWLRYDKEIRLMMTKEEFVRRKAQRIALVANSAISAGIDFGDSNDVRSIAELLREGVDGSGAFEHSKFIVDISPEDLDLAETMLSYDNESRVMICR